jgi:hypothetical protein
LIFVKQVEIEEILAGIQETVARRRAEGVYPIGLENELEAEFKFMLSLTHRGEAERADALALLLKEALRAADEVSGLAPAKSRIPFVGIFHRVVRRLIARQTRGLAAQQRAVNEAVLGIMEHLVSDARGREDADHRMVANLSKHVLDRVAVIDHLYFVVTELETRIRKLEATD